MNPAKLNPAFHALFDDGAQEIRDLLASFCDESTTGQLVAACKTKVLHILVERAAAAIADAIEAEARESAEDEAAQYSTETESPVVQPEHGDPEPKPAGTHTL